MNKSILSIAMSGLLFFLCISNSANAALESRLGGKAVYDTDLDITWLANFNLARSNKFGVSGLYSFGSIYRNQADEWLGALNRQNYLGYNDWRLPESNNCLGICRDSELGHLFYHEFNASIGDRKVLASNDKNVSLFSNLGIYKKVNLYGSWWIRTDIKYNAPFIGLRFDTYGGIQRGLNGTSRVIPVRDGDVEKGDATNVPAPGSLALVGLGLIGTVITCRRKQSK